MYLAHILPLLLLLFALVLLLWWDVYGSLCKCCKHATPHALLQVAEQGIHGFVLQHISKEVPLLMVGNVLNVNTAYNNIQSNLEHMHLYRYPIDVYYPGTAHPYLRHKMSLSLVTAVPLRYNVCPRDPGVHVPIPH